jgi:hypothetical protein
VLDIVAREILRFACPSTEGFDASIPTHAKHCYAIITENDIVDAVRKLEADRKQREAVAVPR